MGIKGADSPEPALPVSTVTITAITVNFNDGSWHPSQGDSGSGYWNRTLDFYSNLKKNKQSHCDSRCGWAMSELFSFWKASTRLLSTCDLIFFLKKVFWAYRFLHYQCAYGIRMFPSMLLFCFGTHDGTYLKYIFRSGVLLCRAPNVPLLQTAYIFILSGLNPFAARSQWQRSSGFACTNCFLMIWF